jgi:hypothetical protein
MAYPQLVQIQARFLRLDPDGNDVPLPALDVPRPAQNMLPAVSWSCDLILEPQKGQFTLFTLEF